MPTQPDPDEVLDRMRDEGRISDEEYDALRGEVVDDARPSGEDDTDLVDYEKPAEVSDPTPRLPKLTLRRDLTSTYLTLVLIGLAGLLVASSVGLLPWLVPILAIPTFGATLVEGGNRVALAGGLLIVFVVITALVGGGTSPSTEAAPTAIAPANTTVPAPSESLGIFLPDLAEQWNVVSGSPNITKGFTRYSEAGEYDSFLYRFGDWGRLAGVYDPSTDAVYAILATGHIRSNPTSGLFQRLCFVLYPFSQECIDTYKEQGLDSGALEDFVDVDHNAEWKMGDQTWRLEIKDNILTIRVLAPSTDF